MKITSSTKQKRTEIKQKLKTCKAKALPTIPVWTFHFRLLVVRILHVAETITI